MTFIMKNTIYFNKSQESTPILFTSRWYTFLFKDIVIISYYNNSRLGPRSSTPEKIQDDPYK